MEFPFGKAARRNFGQSCALFQMERIGDFSSYPVTQARQIRVT